MGSTVRAHARADAPVTYARYIGIGGAAKARADAAEARQADDATTIGQLKTTIAQLRKDAVASGERAAGQQGTLDSTLASLAARDTDLQPPE